VRVLDARIGHGPPGDPLQAELARSWHDHRDEIAAAVDRAEQLGRAMAAAREATRRHALEEFRRLFAPGDVIDVARRADRT
jgi:transcription elongation GreA/GreB family factor